MYCRFCNLEFQKSTSGRERERKEKSALIFSERQEKQL
jgi:hypothetical protein